MIGAQHLRVSHFFTLFIQSVNSILSFLPGVVLSFSPHPASLIQAHNCLGSFWSVSYWACWESVSLWITRIMLHSSKLFMSLGSWSHSSQLMLFISSPSTHPGSRAGKHPWGVLRHHTLPHLYSFALTIILTAILLPFCPICSSPNPMSSAYSCP